MKRKVSLMLMLVLYFMPNLVTAQITNDQVNYELYIDQWQQTCDNDGLSADDNEVRVGLSSDAMTGGTATWTSGGNGASCGGNLYVRRWQSDAPSTVTNNNTLMYRCLNRSGAATSFNVYHNSWEEDGSPDCDPSGDACQSSGTWTMTYRGGTRTPNNFWAYNGTLATASWVTGMSGNFSAKTVWRYTNGNSCGTPLNFGTLTSAVTYTHNNSNRFTPAGASTDLGYSNVSGNAAADVFYQFTISTPSTVVVSTMGTYTNYDTYLRLYSTGCGTQLAFNDDFNSTTKSQITIALCAGTYIAQVEGFSSNTGDFELAVTATSLVLNGGTIAGITNAVNICPNTDPGAFTSTLDANNGVPGYVYQWESSTTSAGAGYSSIIGAGTTTYDPGNLTQTTWFRRRVTDACGQVTYSNVIQVVVGTGLSSAGMATGDYIWYGGISNDWLTGGNWYIYNGSALNQATTPPGAATNVFIPSISGCVTNIPTVLTNNCFALDLTVQPGGALNLGAGGNLQVSDSWYNNSGNSTNIFSAVGSTVTFVTNALTLREISGNTSTTFANLANNNNGFLEVDILTNITGTFTMNGNFILNARLILGTSPTNTGTLIPTAGNIMVGSSYFRRYFNNVTNAGNSGLFPMGVSAGTFSRWARYEFTTPSTSGGWIEVRFVPTPLTLYTGLPILNDAGVDIQNYMNEGYWEANTGGGFTGGVYSLTLNRDGITTVNNPAALRIIKSPGPAHSTWIADGTHGTVAGNTVSRTGMSGFSWFVISSNMGNPLPVELISFNANCNTQSVDLTWRTSSETNSSHFSIERSVDGITWTEIGRVNAAGNSNSILSYFFSDESPFNGISYYRLVQQDHNGESEIFDPVAIQCHINNGKINLLVYPNPNNGEYIVKLIASNPQTGTGTIEVMDMMGKTVFNKHVEIKEGENTFNMNTPDLMDGVYNLRITHSSEVLGSLKIVIRK